jgi:hypothetical protein
MSQIRRERSASPAPRVDGAVFARRIQYAPRLPPLEADADSRRIEETARVNVLAATDHAPSRTTARVRASAQ